MKHDHPLASIDMDSVLEELEADRKQGTLANKVTGSAVRYGVDPDDSSRLVAVDIHGKHALNYD